MPFIPALWSCLLDPPLPYTGLSERILVNNRGRISIKGTKYHDAVMQKEKLVSEGIAVSDDLTFDIEKYRFRPNVKISD